MLTPPKDHAVSDLVREQMAKGTRFRFRVVSGSMAPMINIGDWVTARRVEARDLRRGDILVYLDRDTVRVHRLLSMQTRDAERLLATKGDATLDPDRSWSEEELLGKVVMVERGENRINLDDGLCHGANRLLGVISRCEVFILESGRGVRQFALGRQKGRLPARVRKMIRAPFRLSTRVIAVALWSRRGHLPTRHQHTIGK